MGFLPPKNLYNKRFKNTSTF